MQVGAVVGIIGGGLFLLAFIYKIYKIINRVETAIGVDEQGRTMSERMDRVEYQLWENGGNSMKDQMNAQGALAKQTAIENLRSKQVREVLNYTQWLTLERRWAEKAIKAAAKGDTAQAAEFARYRLINSYMYSEGKKLAEKIEKMVAAKLGVKWAIYDKVVESL